MVPTDLGYGSLSFAGVFRMPAGFDFARFDPNADTGGGRRIQMLLTDLAGSQRWGTTLAGTYAGPGTVGWVRTGSTWTFFGSPGNAMGTGGLTRLVLSASHELRNAAKRARVTPSVSACYPARDGRGRRQAEDGGRATLELHPYDRQGRRP